jgi:hypothetical protein
VAYHHDKLLTYENHALRLVSSLCEVAADSRKDGSQRGLSSLGLGHLMHMCVNWGVLVGFHEQNTSRNYKSCC